MDTKDCVPAKEAAKEIGISYELFMARVRKEKPPYDRTVKIGWGRFMHKRDMKKAKQDQQGK